MAKKRSISEKVLKYLALFEPQTEGGFTVTVPSLTGCISEGETFEEALINIREAIELYLEDVKEKDLQNVDSSIEAFVAPVAVRVRAK